MDVIVERGPRPWRAVRVKMRLGRHATQTGRLTWSEVREFFPEAEVAWDPGPGASWAGHYLRIHRVAGPRTGDNLGWDELCRIYPAMWGHRHAREIVTLDRPGHVTLAQAVLVAYRTTIDGVLVATSLPSERAFRRRCETLTYHPDADVTDAWRPPEPAPGETQEDETR